MMERFFLKYRRFLETAFILWLFLWMAGKFGFDFSVDLAIFFRVFLGMFLVLMFWEIRIRRAEIASFAKSAFFSAQEQVSLALDQYPTSWSKVIHFLPLMLSFSWKLFKKCVSSKKIVLGLFVLGVLFDTFVFSSTLDFFILILIGLWIRSIKLYNLEGRVSVIGGLILLILGQFLFMLDNDVMAEKAVTWAYVFLIVGVIQRLLEKGR